MVKAFVGFVILCVVAMALLFFSIAPLSGEILNSEHKVMLIMGIGCLLVVGILAFIGLIIGRHRKAKDSDLAKKKDPWTSVDCS